MSKGQFSAMDAAIEREAAATAAVAALANEIAKVAGPIAHFGDGNCGVVLETVKSALADCGLYIDPATSERTPPKKAVIKQGLRTRVLERDRYRCVHCGTHLDLCVDHIHPESKGGTLDETNLQTLCRSCNSKKGSKA